MTKLTILVPERDGLRKAFILGLKYNRFKRETSDLEEKWGDFILILLKQPEKKPTAKVVQRTVHFITKLTVLVPQRDGHSKAFILGLKYNRFRRENIGVVRLFLTSTQSATCGLRRGVCDNSNARSLDFCRGWYVCVCAEACAGGAGRQDGTGLKSSLFLFVFFF